MNDLHKALMRAVDDKQVMGLDFGDTIDPSDEAALKASILNGVKRYGHYVDDPEITLTLVDVWKYYEGDELIEDETGCVIVKAAYGGLEARVVLQWAHVNGGIAVDTDGDGV